MTRTHRWFTAHTYATYKIVVIVCFAVLCGTLAIRIKGKILLLWVVVILRYNLRPRFYVFNRNNEHLRDVSQPVKAEEVTVKRLSLKNP